MADESKLKLLTTQREYAFRDMQILYDLSKKLSTDKSAVTQFKARFKRVEVLRKEYLEYINQINAIMLELHPEKAIDMQAMGAFDDMYYSVVSTADTVQYSGTAMSIGSSSSEYSFQSAKPFSQARLPKLELPKFDGNIEYWQTFFDTFSSLVHNNNNISSIEKFHYLLSCISGSALSIAKGIPVTADNYNIVFEALVERFQNKRVLAATYLDKISNFTPLKSSNFQDLRDLTNILHETVNALKAIKIKELDEFILFYLASRVLDIDTRKRFEIQANQDKIPTFTDLLTFLQGYIKILEVSQSGTFADSNKSQKAFNNQMNRTGDPQNKSYNRNYKSASLPASTDIASDSAQRSVVCCCCGEAHSIFKCPNFQELSIPERHNLVSNKRLCTNCLRSNHSVNKCFSKINCSACGKRHHSLLHDQDSTVVTPNDSAGLISEVSNLTINSTSTSAIVGIGRAFVLLGTCIVRVRGCGQAPAQDVHARALIDSGAQDTFMTASLARRLGLPIRRCNLVVAGLGENVVHKVAGETSCTILPRNSENPAFNVNAIVMNSITSKMPTIELPSTVRKNFQHLVLADEHFDKPTDIDLLLGAELFHSIYDGQRLVVGPGLPVALHSVFGWVLSGRVDSDSLPPPKVSSLVASTRTLDAVVKRFWEIEEPPTAVVPNPEDLKCEELYSKLVSRNPDGRYVVPLLLKEPCEAIGDSSKTAMTRLTKLEKRLAYNSELKAGYTDFMTEYEVLGHMQPSTLGSGKYVIPHHCVIRAESVSTKLRVVFDASAKTASGLSLNDIVYTGPKLQNDIVNILTKFRIHAIVFTSDISKMSTCDRRIDRGNTFFGEKHPLIPYVSTNSTQ